MPSLTDEQKKWMKRGAIGVGVLTTGIVLFAVVKRATRSRRV